MKNSELNQYYKDLSPRPFAKAGKIWVGVLLVVCAIGLFAYIKQLRFGLSVTAMRDYVTWGIYISNFVFFVAVSLVGSLISAILKLTKARWATPLTRVAEIIAVASIMFAGLIIIVDMGRPERFTNLFIHGRIQSPIVWDVIVITTYLVISVLLLYMPLIPDLALLRDKGGDFPKWQRNMYKKMSLGWTGLPEQERLLKRSIRILAILIIPVAFGIHTVTSWLFASTLRPGWDSTDFGPYFVAGAFMAGAAGVIAGMYILRNHYGLQKYFTTAHFDTMGKLLVLLSLVYLYFNLNEYFMPAYKMKGEEGEHLKELLYGAYAPMFWSVQVFGMLLPTVLLLFKKFRKPTYLFMISVLVIIGAWFKRFLIVVPTLTHPFIPTNRVPESWLHYYPTWEEWAITIGSLAGALLVITFLVRLFPVVPIVETLEGHDDEVEEAEDVLKTNGKKIGLTS